MISKNVLFKRTLLALAVASLSAPSIAENVSGTSNDERENSIDKILETGTRFGERTVTKSAFTKDTVSQKE